MQPVIRPASLYDLPTILRFIRELAEYEKLAHMVVATEDTLRETLFGADAKTFCLIAELDGKPAGFTICFYNFSTFLGRNGIYIEDLYVDPAYRGYGVGKAVLRYLAQKAVDENLGRVEWAVLDWNQPAIDFYRSLGAEALDEWVVYRLSGEALGRLASTGKEKAA